MPQSVDKLKELLFDNEARALDVLTRRMESVEHLALDEHRRQNAISQRIDAVFDRAGTTDRFEFSVAEVLDGALRRAEVDRHAELASAIAPLVVRTVKTEIRNSRDELVEALYPMTGRMVKAYVASAMKDLAKDINRKLEQNPVMLRLRSLAAGKSVAEIAIAESQRLEVEELYLIRRGSGELVGRWPESQEGAAGRDHVMSGVLTAINEFSTEALKDEGSALRQIDLGERQLYLRVSPSFLLAAKCSGSAPVPVEEVLDDSFLQAIEELQQLTAGGGNVSPQQSTKLLGGLSENLATRLDEKTGELANEAAGISPLRLLAWIIGLPFAAWLIWMVYADYRTERANAIAARTLAGFGELKGYPVSVDVSRLGAEVTVSGLAPAVEAKDALLKRMQEALPKSVVNDRLSVLPNDLAAVEPRIAGVKSDVTALAPQVEQANDAVADARNKIADVQARVLDVERQARINAQARSLDRANWRLNEAKGTVAALKGSLSAPVELEALAKAADSIQLGLAGLDVLRAPATSMAETAGTTQLASVSQHIRKAEMNISALVGLTPAAIQSPANGAPTADYLAAEADRLAGAAIAAAQVIAVKKSLPKPPPPVELTAREKLGTFAKSNAIFFTNEVDFRDPKQSTLVLDQLAALMKGNDVLIRVVGYTDDQGPTDKNTSLSSARSTVVVEALKDRGVQPSRLVSIGRVDLIGISPERGASSSNRRVEFEVGFVGENAP